MRVSVYKCLSAELLRAHVQTPTRTPGGTVLPRCLRASPTCWVASTSRAPREALASDELEEEPSGVMHPGSAGRGEAGL